MPKCLNRAALSAIGLVAMGAAASADELTLYCSVQQSWCEATAAAFSAATGVDVAMQRKDTGAALASLCATRGFSGTRQMIEITGVCAACQTAQH